MEDKHLYREEFGEMMVGKGDPALYVFNLQTSKVEEVFGVPKDTFPMCPVWYKDSQGIVFSGLYQPQKKMGLTYCLNRKANLFFIKDPVFKKPDSDLAEDYIVKFAGDDFLQMQPKFNSDYSKLVFFGSPDEFLSHTSCYEMR